MNDWTSFEAAIGAVRKLLDMCSLLRFTILLCLLQPLVLHLGQLKVWRFILSAICSVLIMPDVGNAQPKIMYDLLYLLALFVTEPASNFAHSQHSVLFKLH